MRRSLGGNVAGEQRHAGEDGEHGDEGHRITRFGLKEQRRNPFSGDERNNGADGNAHESQAQGAVYHAGENVAAAGTQGHANAYFLALARHQVGDDSVNSQRGENQAERSEGTHQHDEEAQRRC